MGFKSDQKAYEKFTRLLASELLASSDASALSMDGNRLSIDYTAALPTTLPSPIWWGVWDAKDILEGGSVGGDLAMLDLALTDLTHNSDGVRASLGLIFSSDYPTRIITNAGGISLGESGSGGGRLGADAQASDGAVATVATPIITYPTGHVNYAGVAYSYTYGLDSDGARLGTTNWASFSSAIDTKVYLALFGNTLAASGTLKIQARYRILKRVVPIG
jgi:hypothetical protein